MTYEKGRNEKRWAGIRWEELRWDELWSVKSVVWNVGREECSVKCEECSVKFFRHQTSSWVRWYVSCLFDLCWLRWLVGDLQFGWGSAFRISWTLVGTCNCFFTSTMGNFDLRLLQLDDQLTLSAYCRSTSLRTACAFAMALAAYDWLVWKDRAASFLRAHPREVALQLTWGQRLVVPGAREAYAVVTYEREAMGRSLGAAPCNLCGCWTHSWCEACKTRLPTAICSTCDAAKLLCQSCTSCHQLVYSEASQKPN